MTLVIALSAHDGVVMVADGQATAGHGPLPTRTAARKLGILNERVLYGMAGSAGLRQRVVANIEQEIRAEDCGLPITELRPILLAAVNVIQRQAVGELVRLDFLGSRPATVEVLFAGVSDDGCPWIYEITQDGSEEVHQRAEAIGKGRPYARYALMSADHYRLAERGLAQVRLLAYRAVDDAIRTDAQSLGGPIMLLEATRNGAREIQGTDLESLKTSLAAWQQHEQEIFEQQGALPLAPHGPAATPEPPEHGLEPPTEPTPG
jgi:20S proteasome alpha/beta subunit